ncbi:S8 family serine peptidase [Mucilaginibacter sp. BT774]|uniref:S8 family serine peptidase n=1 Tax=Mucilaginibacter sp. BT774 TaxID=3062276 RepID=UPI0026749B14|nr:S8 family serine peptidase [Mucilaginibacter sp. BT774]MDO3624592.1 S8 family serine peptidase [Mucilaginibacter sp. BT774]
MIKRELLYKMLLLLSMVALSALNGFAQQLAGTSWKSSGVASAQLHFAKDTVWINSHKNSPLSFSFSQKRDTLFLYGSSKKDNHLESDTSYYKVRYTNNSQHLTLSAIKGHHADREKNFTGRFNYVPEEDGAPRDWSYMDAMSDSIAGISLYKAYELLKVKKLKPAPVIVAVIDNGFDIGHEDLKGSIWTNTREIPGNGIDDDHNGYVDDVHGWNFRGDKNGHIVDAEQSGATQTYAAFKSKYENADTSHLTDREKKLFSIYKKARAKYFETLKTTKDSVDLKYAYNVDYISAKLIQNDNGQIHNHSYGSAVITSTEALSHGTHVAGIIAAKRNNGKGVDGIADNVRIMPIIATTGPGDERDKDIANGIFYAVNNGARIINMSFSKRYSPYKKLVDSAVQYAELKHVLIIHAAGNDGNNNDTANYYPIAYYQNGHKASNFITVGWSRPLFNYRLAHPYSGYGKNNVDLFAPGSDIFSTVPGDLYDYKSGSSMSTPCVTGVAALLLSYFPDLTAEQVKDILLLSSFKPNIMVNRPGGSKIQVPFSSLSVSGGIVNAHKAVQMAIELSGK